MKNKNIYLTILFGLLLSFQSFACDKCGCRAESNKITTHTHNSNTTTNDIYAQKSQVKWKANKVGGEHEGNVEIRAGHLHFENKKLVSGTVDIDMNSINCTDLKDSYKDQLENHLKSEDFFDSENHPIATMELLECKYKGYGKYDINADVTIKGITNAENFSATVKNGIASAKIIIDRSKYDVKYGSDSFFSNLGDNMIYDEFELDVSITY